MFLVVAADIFPLGLREKQAASFQFSLIGKGQRGNGERGNGFENFSALLSTFLTISNKDFNSKNL